MPVRAVPRAHHFCDSGQQRKAKAAKRTEARAVGDYHFRKGPVREKSIRRHSTRFMGHLSLVSA